MSVETIAEHNVARVQLQRFKMSINTAPVRYLKRELFFFHRFFKTTYLHLCQYQLVLFITKFYCTIANLLIDDLLQQLQENGITELSI